MGWLVTVWRCQEGGGMLVGMGELCDQVLLQSLPTDGRLDAGPSPCAQGWCNWLGGGPPVNPYQRRT